jgi:uncharacterized protein YidB (DUF937 family)
MGLFDSLVSGALKGAFSQGESSQLPGLLSQLLGKTDFGSLGGLLAQLQQRGLGSEVSSWLSNGQNLPTSPEQLRSVLGNEQLQQLARSAGLPVDALLSMLALQLPGAVDKMSPNGKLEEGDAPQSDAPDSDTSAQGSLADQAGLGDVKA